MHDQVNVIEGNSPLVLSQPHGGIWLPNEIRLDLNEIGQQLADTDWHIARLYDQLIDDVTIIEALFHRYVIDVNRDIENKALYQEQQTTALCPLTDFNGEPIYQRGKAPTAAAVAERLHWYHNYHQKLQQQIERIKSIHGFVIVYDCHSIRSQAPYLFDGQLPVLNIGTYSGLSCAKVIEQSVHEICLSSSDYSTVVNGRFKGGFITRHYGRPDQHIHVLQMEIAQRSYMQEEAPWTYEQNKASKLRLLLKEILQTLCQIHL